MWSKCQPDPYATCELSPDLGCPKPHMERAQKNNLTHVVGQVLAIRPIVCVLISKVHFKKSSILKKTIKLSVYHLNSI